DRGGERLIARRLLGAVRERGVAVLDLVLAELLDRALERGLGFAEALGAAPAIASAVAIESLGRWADVLVQVRGRAEHPWNEALLIESLVAQGRDALVRLRA
ncbi:MAG TPA: hypothetical protein PKA84_02255, partial [Rubrivivax sp.]|nr:hypothetical protein [Rubrivivax sp.]